MTMTFHGLKYPAPESDPPIGVELYSTVEARDGRLVASSQVPGIEPMEATLQQLSDAELSQAFLRVTPRDPNFSAMTTYYFEEKALRLKKVIEADVDRVLATGDPITLPDLIWMTRYLVANSAFGIGVNGELSLVTNVLIQDGMPRETLRQLAANAGLILTKHLASTVLRLAARAPSVGATDAAQ